jgi:hypothetical protein
MFGHALVSLVLHVSILLYMLSLIGGDTAATPTAGNGIMGSSTSPISDKRDAMFSASNPFIIDSLPINLYRHGSKHNTSAVTPVGVTTKHNRAGVVPADPARTISHELCHSKGYGKIAPLPEEKKRLPAVLYSIPASGNTWFRVLLEHATGVQTGCVYGQVLVDSTPQKCGCNWQLSLVKIHPSTHSWTNLTSGYIQSYHDVCRRGGVTSFERGIVLVRDPFETIFIHYQRRTTQTAHQGISRKNFNHSVFEARAIILANWYVSMWKEIQKLYDNFAANSNALMIRYEDLRNSSTRYYHLHRAAAFLGMVSPQGRVPCAFCLAQYKETAHVYAEGDILIQQAYRSKEVICTIWNILGHIFQGKGYRPFGGISCPSNPVQVNAARSSKI